MRVSVFMHAFRDKLIIQYKESEPVLRLGSGRCTSATRTTLTGLALRVVLLPVVEVAGRLRLRLGLTVAMAAVAALLAGASAHASGADAQEAVTSHYNHLPSGDARAE